MRRAIDPTVAGQVASCPRLHPHDLLRCHECDLIRAADEYSGVIDTTAIVDDDADETKTDWLLQIAKADAQARAPQNGDAAHGHGVARDDAREMLAVVRAIKGDMRTIAESQGKIVDAARVAVGRLAGLEDLLYRLAK